MFSDLLNYSKPLDIRRKEISVEDLVDKCVQELVGEIAARNVAIERTIPEELPPIIGDPDKIEQVLVNVLKNALDASERNGTIDVSASTEESDSGSMVIITVEDHGSGISQRNLKNIFQPFFTTKKRGTGLGLAIVKKIMDAHRGDIAVSSEQGRGTTVRLSFQGFRGVK
jgi:two-component system sensor histidine kinase HydH